ncbi:ABC transporter permease [Chlorobiota bacterium]|nr:ABC transporter permease [Chlorobiota bacterium]
MSFHLIQFIALRYIFSLKKLSFISFITFLSYLGITTGIAALICVSSIFNGFRDLVQDMLLSIDPHIRISQSHGNLKLSDTLIHFTKKVDNVLKVISCNTGKIIIHKNSILQPAVLSSQSELPTKLAIENFVLFTHSTKNNIFIGSALADKLQVMKGDTIHISSLAMIDAVSSGLFQSTGIPVIIAGVFQVSGGMDYDKYLCFSSESLGATLFGSRTTNIDIIASETKFTEKIKSLIIQNPLFSSLIIKDWNELHKELYATMEYERTASFIVISLVACVAAFNILVSLWMTVHTKRKDIGMLLSMGLTTNQIKHIFLFKGMIIGIAGTVSGTVIGLLLCKGQQLYGWIPIANSIVKSLPVSIHSIDIITSCLLTLGLAFIATIYPSSIAAKTSITESLRYE